ncbi:response regulator [Motilimonas sp. E26]|uniref:response regulator n=1 Tax=Motilimonas TaxID=1914248 RepID=UPI001E301B1B|nr:response regulator [Motilimonas sp. E26]MCE0557729.1 response regulator [Motilimonas sp. E26]
MKILVVEDTICLRHIMLHMLRELGHTDLEEAADGTHALHLLAKHQFDLVITDYNMPKINGLQLLKHIRANELTADLPVLIVTSDADKSHLTQAIQAKVSGFLAKPFSLTILKKQMDKIIQKRNQSAANKTTRFIALD